MNEYLTTKELAELLRIKERKVYDLAASGEIPCSRAMGKLLFPRLAVDAWLAENSSGFATVPTAPRPNVFLGSHDPLLDWALRESRCGLATFLDGSFDGLDRFAKGEGIAAGLHIFAPETGNWNTAVVTERFAGARAVLVEWAWRERGLIVGPDATEAIAGVASLGGRRVIPRQAEAGSQKFLEHLLGEAGLGADDVDFTAPARNESDAALAVLEGKADAAFGLKAMASQYRLGFVPVATERFDLLVDRRAW
ncbi:MAG: substrate-binding domain-containing protein, partial [Methyloligellaceae bacterium]